MCVCEALLFGKIECKPTDFDLEGRRIYKCKDECKSIVFKLDFYHLLIIMKLILQFPLQLASDTVYFLCVNGLGLYFRLMSEVAIRRTFLDRRACLESNSKVEYEKQQEVSFIRNKIFKK